MRAAEQQPQRDRHERCSGPPARGSQTISADHARADTIAKIGAVAEAGRTARRCSGRWTSRSQSPRTVDRARPDRGSRRATPWPAWSTTTTPPRCREQDPAPDGRAAPRRRRGSGVRAGRRRRSTSSSSPGSATWSTGSTAPATAEPDPGLAAVESHGRRGRRRRGRPAPRARRRGSRAATGGEVRADGRRAAPSTHSVDPVVELQLGVLAQVLDRALELARVALGAQLRRQRRCR